MKRESGQGQVPIQQSPGDWRMLRDYFRGQSDQIRYVISPFIQADTLNMILPEDEGRLVVVTRWGSSDIASGVSDLNAFQVAQERDATFRIFDRLHLKAYTQGLQGGIVGSANVTATALGLHDRSNEELLLGPVEFTPETSARIWKIVQSSDLVTESMWEKALEWAEQNRERPAHLDPIPLQTEKRLTVDQLPVTKSPATLISNAAKFGTPEWEALPEEVRDRTIHDIVALDLYSMVRDTETLRQNDLRNAFFSTPFIREIEAQIAPEIYFGQLKAWIQENCEDTPIPTRRSLTENVKSLMRWFPTLAPGRYKVDIPHRRSQRLKRL